MSGSSASFFAFVRRNVVAAYDAYNTTSGSTGQTEYAHYVLFDDGTYLTYYGNRAANEASRLPWGRYKVKADTVTFGGPFPNPQSTWAEGIIEGSSLTIHYYDVDTDVELYTKRTSG